MLLNSAVFATLVVVVLSVESAQGANLTRPTVVTFGSILNMGMPSVFPSSNKILGIEAAIKDAHDNDELFGTTIKMVYKNGTGVGSPIAYNETKELVENDGVFGMLGTDFDSSVYSWMYCNEFNIPNLAPLAVHDPMFEQGSNSTFFVMQSFVAETNQMVNFAINSELNCWDIFVVHSYLFESLANETRSNLESLGFPTPRLYSIPAGRGNITDVLEALFGNSSRYPHCIIYLGEVDGLVNLINGLETEPHYDQNVTFVIAPSASVKPSFSIRGNTTPFDNVYHVQAFADPNESLLFKSVAAYQASVTRFFADPTWNVTLQRIGIERFVDRRGWNFDAYQGYVNARFLIEVMKRMPSFTREAMIETIFNTKTFQIEDLLLGPYVKECGNSFAASACWCNSGSHQLYVTRLVDGTPRMISDNATLGENQVAYRTIPLTQCSLESDIFSPPITVLVQLQLASSPFEDEFRNITANVLLAQLQAVNKDKLVSNGLQIRPRPQIEDYATLASSQENTYAFSNSTASEYGAMAIVGEVAFETDLPSFVTPKYFMDNSDPAKELFSRNVFYFSAVMADHIHALARYIVDNVDGEIIVVGHDEQLTRMAVDSLHTFQVDPSAQHVISDAADVSAESFMSSKVGTAANILIATQNFEDIVGAFFYAIEYPQSRVMVATSEAMLGTVMQYIGQNTSVTGHLSFADYLKSNELNIVFASAATAWWDPVTVPLSLVGDLPDPVPFALFSAMISATVIYESANKYALEGNVARDRAKPTALADALYTSQTLSVNSIAFGPFSDQECHSDQLAAKSTSCQCNKGPRKFYVHHVNDWMEGATSSNLRTSNFAWSMSSCGVSYEALATTADYSVAIAIAATLFAVTAFAVAGALYRSLTAPARDNSAAPTNSDEPFTIVFTDIQSSTSLWARAGEQMSDSVEKHHSLIRKLIKKFDGYEVKTIGDSFMVAFSSTKKGVDFALSIQSTFFDEKWPSEIDSTYISLEQEKREALAEETSTPLPLPVDLDMYARSWNGLRVRIGCHYGFGNIKFDPTVLGYDYYGTVVNTAARVEGVGHGGQVLLTGAALSALIEENEGSIPADYVVMDLGPQPLRGLDEPVVLHQFLTTAIKGREFPELRLDIEKTGADSETEEEVMSTLGSMGSSHHSQMTTESTTIAIEKYAEHICRKWKGDLSFVGTYHDTMATFNFFKSLYSTSTSSHRHEAVEHLGKKWRVEKSRTLKGPLADSVRIMNVIVKVKKTMEVSQKPPTENASSKLNGTNNDGPTLASCSQGDGSSPQLLPNGVPLFSMRRNSQSIENISVGEQQPSQLTPRQPTPASHEDSTVFMLQDPPQPRNPRQTYMHPVEEDTPQ